jgi:hypothetical protein
MPRWGRPPGARKGRHNGGGGQYEDQMARVEEVETDEDEYGRQLVRNGRAAYRRQLEYGGRGPRRRQDYDDLTDGESVVDGGDYDLYDHEDSTVAYAVQLAMRDKEDQLVDKALERIRRAQMLGRKTSDFHSANWMPWNAGASRRTDPVRFVGPSKVEVHPILGLRLDANPEACQNSHQDLRGPTHNLHMGPKLGGIGVPEHLGDLLVRPLRTAREPQPCSPYVPNSPALRFDRAIPPSLNACPPTAAHNRCSRCNHDHCRTTHNGHLHTTIPCK